MTEYFLPDHVYFCGRGDAIIFLDVRNDEYTMVNGIQARAVRSLAAHAAERSLIDGSGSLSFVHFVSEELSDAAGELLAGGLLTTECKNGRPVIPSAIELPSEPLVDDEVVGAVRVLPLHVCRFFLACGTAALRLRLQSIESIVRSVQGRKVARKLVDPTDLDRARLLAAIFHKLRDLFPAKYLCLFDSLALIEFLAYYKLFPDWIFAVQFEPWAAHCWVQEGPIIFNEDVEEAADYVPVMAV